MKEEYEFIQAKVGKGSTEFRYKSIEKWAKDHTLLQKIDEIPFEAKEEDPDLIYLGLFDNIEFKMFKINKQYWLPRVFLEKFYENIARSFNRLKKERVKGFNRFWLEEGEDFIKINIEEFGQKYGWTFFPPAQRGGQAIFLSPIGTIRLLSRTSKTYNILFWLTIKYEELRLIQFEKSKEIEILREQLKTDLKEVRKKLRRQNDLIEKELKTLEILCSRNLELVNKQVNYWFQHYQGDKTFGYHPHTTLRKKWFWDEAEKWLGCLSKIKNKSKIICVECGKEIIEKPLIHHTWNLQDYKNKKKWRSYFDPKECGLVHKKCHSKIHNK